MLTHHQPFSEFERCFGKPVKQLAEAGFSDGREFIWLFGHEHRLTIYNKQRLAGSMTAYPRCIGHAGMPVKVTKLTRPNPDILYYDPRVHPIDDRDLKTMVGYNGHVVLLFEGEKLTIEYHDIERTDVLLTETFTPRKNRERCNTAHCFSSPRTHWFPGEHHLSSRIEQSRLLKGTACSPQRLSGRGNSCFVSGHDFSRAVKYWDTSGFSPDGRFHSQRDFSQPL